MQLELLSVLDTTQIHGGGVCECSVRMVAQPLCCSPPKIISLNKKETPNAAMCYDGCCHQSMEISGVSCFGLCGRPAWGVYYKFDGVKYDC